MPCLLHHCQAPETKVCCQVHTKHSYCLMLLPIRYCGSALMSGCAQ